MKAWVLSEGFDHKPDKIVAIALTNEEASAWVLKISNPGYSRTSIPFDVVGGETAAGGRLPETRSQDFAEIEMILGEVEAALKGEATDFGLSFPVVRAVNDFRLMSQQPLARDPRLEQLEREMRRDGGSMLMDSDDHNALAASKAMLEWADTIKAILSANNCLWVALHVC